MRTVILDRPTASWLYSEIFDSEVARDDDWAAGARVPPSKATPKKVFLSCHNCAYTPEDGLPETGVCPKCNSTSWDRYALSARLVPAHLK